MREANFSIPNANKASVGITTALYDRRALDCTSTLPLINSLNHLAYLTNSSARIREILTVDGGVEKLISILKDGRSCDTMEAWKWNLAFQCVVNIGVRGSDARSAESRSSENVRTRVVEADIVPVIATILNNYMQALEKWKAKNGIDADVSRSRAKPSRSSKRAAMAADAHAHAANLPTSTHRLDHSRRRQPPPAHIDTHRLTGRTADEPHVLPPREVQNHDSQPPQVNVVSSDRPPVQQGLEPRPQRARPANWRRHSQEQRREAMREAELNPRDAMDIPGFTPLRDIDGLGSPSALPHLGVSSQPESPTTPAASRELRPAPASGRSISVGRAANRRPSVQRQTSSSGASDDDSTDLQNPRSAPLERASARITEHHRSDVNMDDVTPSNFLDGDDSQNPQAVAVADVLGNAEGETFEIAIRSAEVNVTDADARDARAATRRLSPVPQQPFATMPPHIPEAPAMPPSPQMQRPRAMPAPTRPPVDTSSPSVVRDEDVIMSLQLLAYVSKYTNLRSYFLGTHLVPKLEITESELTAYENGERYCPKSRENITNDEEYCQEDDFNIFPLVEKFTVRHHSTDMKDWAGVVMRNLCRKDKSRGDTRQCAYYKCGKWEEFQRQFAKCRACRQTKYCSKECQKQAWVYHRHWCQQPERAAGPPPSSAHNPPPSSHAAAVTNWTAVDS